jgi:glutathione peroxidase
VLFRVIGVPGTNLDELLARLDGLPSGGPAKVGSNVIGCRVPYAGAMSLFDTPLHTLDGRATTLAEHEGKSLLIVNVASKCGLTPQYTGLERLQEAYEARGFTVLGFPCNQFGAQEPGAPEEIATFCSTTYGVSFPLYEKIEVNGEGRHPLYQELVTASDAEGEAGDIQWNFEKFLVSPIGEIVARFRPAVEPEDPQVVAAIEASLPV